MIFLTTLFIAVFKAYLSGPTTSTQSTRTCVLDHIFTTEADFALTKLRLLPMVFILILTAVFIQYLTFTLKQPNYAQVRKCFCTHFEGYLQFPPEKEN